MRPPDARPLCDGTWKVVRFNWPKYAAVAAALAVACAWTTARLPAAGSVVLWTVAGAGTLWTGTSLLATWWVYDHVHVYDHVSSGLGPVGRYATVHSGFDDATRPLECSVGHGAVAVVDLHVVPRGSLRRARGAPAPGRGSRGTLPVESASLDSIFMTFAIHEVRSIEDQRALFCELHRVLAPGGRLIITEHLRDAANLGAFGPGALHFQPRSRWAARAREARFELVLEDRVTPFVRRLAWQR